MLISRKTGFLIANFLVVFAMVLSNTDSPMAGPMVKVKYIFLGYCIVDLFLRRQKPANNIVLAIMFIFLFYTIVWGYVFDNSHVAAWNAEHRKTMMLYIPMLFCGAFELNYYRCEDGYFLSSAAALSAVTLLQLATHIGELSLNPVKTIIGIITENRIKSAFGYMHVNLLGNSCFVTLICLFMVSHTLSDNSLFHSKKKLLVFALEVVIWFVFLSSTCRTALITTSMYLMGSTAIHIYESERLPKGSKYLYAAVLICGSAFVLALSILGGFWGYVWSHSNRSLNVSENLRWVGVIGTKWTGMGYVDNQCFYRDELAGGIGGFGVATSSLDMNYLFIYCSTGILGTALFASMTILMGVGIVMNYKQRNGPLYILIYLTVLFYAYWETVLFTYRFWPMLVPTTFLLYASNGELKREDNYNRIAPSGFFLRRKK